MKCIVKEKILNNAFINVTRGSGREYVTVAVIVRALASNYKKVYAAAFNFEFVEALSKELDNVVPLKEMEIPTFFNTHWTELHNDLDIYTEEPYNLGAFGMRRIGFIDAYKYVTHLQESWIEEFGPSKEYPYIKPSTEIINAAVDFSKQHKKFVIVQFHGGQNPAGMQPNQQYNYNEQGLKRHYPLEMANELTTKLKADGYEVLHYTLPNEPHLKDAIYMQQIMPQLFYQELAKYAEGVITIDSSLMHLASSTAKKMVVIWVQTSPLSFGYQKDNIINLRKVDDKDIGGPSMGAVPLNPVVEYPSVEEVYKAFNN